MVEIVTNKEVEILRLFKTNYLAQLHVRQMAELINKSHVTLLPHLKSLEQKNILVANTVGKNKQYTLNFENIVTKTHLTLVETAETIAYLQEIYFVKAITKNIFDLNLPGTFVLFGSYAKKTFTDDSDVDIFYLGKLSDKEVQSISRVGKVYGKTVHLKKASIKGFASALRKKDALSVEIVKNHVILQNPEPFVHVLWRYYNEKR